MSEFIKHAYKLSSIPRFVSNTLTSPYSVGEHTFRAAMLAMAIIDDYNDKNPKKPINFEEVMKKILLHDIEESVTGDIPSPVKKEGDLRPRLRQANKTILKRDILVDSPRPKEYLSLWDKDKEGETGQVVKIVDKLEGLFAAYFEVKNGNWYLQEPMMKHLEWFESPQGQRLLNKFNYAKQEYQEVVRFLLNQDNEKKKRQEKVENLLSRYSKKKKE